MENFLGRGWLNPASLDLVLGVLDFDHAILARQTTSKICLSVHFTEGALQPDPHGLVNLSKEVLEPLECQMDGFRSR